MGPKTAARRNDKVRDEVAPAAQDKADVRELGTKRVCTECQTKFYDFGKSKVFCPKCKAEVDLLEASHKKITSSSRKGKKLSAAIDETDIVVDGELDPGLLKDSIEDPAELGDDDDLGDDLKINIPEEE